ncbi:MAG: hypothetical protein ACHQJ6_08540 [Candidatus Berkiellales bacterium]
MSKEPLLEIKPLKIKQKGPSVEKGFWQKIKELLFKPKVEKKVAPNGYQEDQTPTSVKDWINAVDTLNPLIQVKRNELDPNFFDEFNLEWLEVSTYLYHAAKLSSKIRECYLILCYRVDQFVKQPEILNRIEFLQATEGGLQCHRAIINLSTLLNKTTAKRLYSDEFISKIHLLELHANALAGYIRAINQFAFRQEAAAQLISTPLPPVVVTTKPNSMLHNYMASTQFGGYSVTEYLLTKAKELKNKEDILLIQRSIDIYDLLKKCYVISRKTTIKNTLDVMAENIEGLTLMLLQEKRELNTLFIHLHQIFNSIESLRFCGNRESRCSQNLFEKAKQARKEMRKACFVHSLGREFIRKIEVKRVTLVRPKSLSK